METEAQKLNFLSKVMQSMADLDAKASTLHLPSPSSLKRLSLLQISLSIWVPKPAPLAGAGGSGEPTAVYSVRMKTETNAEVLRKLLVWPGEEEEVS